MRYNAGSRVATNTTDASIIVQTELCALVCTGVELCPWNFSGGPACPIISSNAGVISRGSFAGIAAKASGEENRRVETATRVRRLTPATVG